jgi:signal transduction histidine kinase
MDLRTQTSLIAAVISLALAASVLLRTRRRRVHWLFSLFGLNIALWYLTTFLLRLLGGAWWERINLVCAVLVPLSASQFFRTFLAEEDRRITRLHRAGFAGAALILFAVFTPLAGHIVVATAIFAYVVLFLFATLAVLYTRGRAMASRFEAARIRYLALVGALAALFTLADYLPYVGLDTPPVGTLLVLIFLYILSQSILRYRLLDLYDLAGRLSVLTALSFTLAGILWALVHFAGGRFFLHAAAAALVALLIFDPLRVKVEDKITQFFFRERYDLERASAALRRRLAHVLELEELAPVLLDGLERSRRVTHASIYLVDHEGHGYDLRGYVGPQPVQRLERVPGRPLIDRLERDGALVLENVDRELEDRRSEGDDREAETLFEIVQTMDALGAGVVLPIQSEQNELYGLLCVRDDRLRDPFSPEEIQLLRGLAAQAAIAVENSRLYRRLKERDRLAALGEMSAGLAHEIRNPLGAIKASAQYLAEEDQDIAGREFLDIIVEEVDRLNRVVSSFLDYARPSTGDPAPTDVNGAVQRTMHLLAPECAASEVRYELDLAEGLAPVRIDVEQLRQVLINLVHNAVQAMENGGQLRIATRARRDVDLHGTSRHWAEILVRDTGPGIPARVLQNLFVPFVTTKSRGAGLGLAISQRLVNAAGGTIEVHSEPGAGTTFVLRLPMAEEDERGPRQQTESTDQPPEPESAPAPGAPAELEPPASAAGPPPTSPEDASAGGAERANSWTTKR